MHAYIGETSYVILYIIWVAYYYSYIHILMLCIYFAEALSLCDTCCYHSLQLRPELHLRAGICKEMNKGGDSNLSVTREGK